MTTSSWIVRAILRAWPSDLRDRHGRALAQTLAQSWDDVHGAAAMWHRTALVADALTAGLQQRRRQTPRRHWSMTMRSMSSTVRSARRALAARPLATLAIVLTLGIGLGATIAMFAVMDAVLLRPLPFPDDRQLVTITERHVTRPLSGASIPAAQDWRALEGVASLGMFTSASGVLRVDTPVRIDGVMVSPGFFQTLGVAPALGRTPMPGDPLLDPDQKIVLSDRLWREQYGSRADVIGTLAHIDNRTYTIIGVMPAEFDYPARSAFWTTLSPDMKSVQNARTLRFMTRAVARLERGVSVADAQRQVSAWETRLRESDGKTMADYRTDVQSLRDEAVGAVRQPIFVAFGGVAVLLLIACCNVAAMLLAHGRARQSALAVQSALGASRGELVRQLVIEGLMLAAAGGVVGAAVAAAVRRGIVALSVDQIPRIDLVRMDWRVAAFVAAAIVATTLVFAVGPALSMTRVNPADVMRTTTRSVTGDRRRLLSGLVALEFALSLALVAVAGLLINSYVRLQRVDLGFTPAGAGIARVTLPLGKPWNDENLRRQFYADLIAHVRATPGVSGAALVSRLPLEPIRGGVDIWPLGDKARVVQTIRQEASPGYFSSVGARLIEGRDFSDADTQDREPVAIVSDVAARHLWPGASAIGKTIEYEFMRGRVTATVVGVSSAIRYDGLQSSTRPEVFVPISQGLALPNSLVFRGSGDPIALVPSLRAALAAVDASRLVTIDDIAAFDDRIASQLARPRFFLALVGAFAVIAFVLAAVGIYSTLSTWIAERRRELGIRIALGATGRQIADLVVRRGLTLAVIGLAIGVGLTLAIGRYLRALLFDVSPSDPFTIAAAALTLAAVAAAACWLPAARAVRVDPIQSIWR